MSDDLVLKDNDEEVKEEEVEFSPTAVLAPAHDPIDLEEDTAEHDDHPNYGTPAVISEDEEEEAAVKNYFFNGFDEETPYEPSELE